MTVARHENRHVKDLWCYVIFFVDGLEEWCLRYCQKSKFVCFLLYVTRFFWLTMSSSCSRASGNVSESDVLEYVQSSCLIWRERQGHDRDFVTMSYNFWICPRSYIFYLRLKQILNNRGQKHAIKRDRPKKKRDEKKKADVKVSAQEDTSIPGMTSRRPRVMRFFFFQKNSPRSMCSLAVYAASRSAASLPVLHRLSSASPFRVRGRPKCSVPMRSHAFVRRFLRSACKCSCSGLPSRGKKKKGWLSTRTSMTVSRWRSLRGSSATASTRRWSVIRLWTRSCLRSKRLSPAARTSLENQAKQGRPLPLPTATWISRFTDGSTVTRPHVSRMFRDTCPTLHRVRCLDQSSQNTSRRLGATVSCQLPSGGLPNITPQTQIHLTCREKKGLLST